MKDFLNYLITTLVDSPDQVQIDEDNQMGYVTLTISVAKEDMGKIIGKEGRVIRAIRDLVRVLATKNNQRANVVLREE